MKNIEKIGFGGGCHWCIEAVFNSVEGVVKVEQGYIASIGENLTFSEAVIVYFDNDVVTLQKLVKNHLLTHASTSQHSFREKYRSAIYYYSETQKLKAESILLNLQKDFKEKVITKILKFAKFRPSRESLQDYFGKNPDAPFCTKYIIPKLKKISII